MIRPRGLIGSTIRPTPVIHSWEKPVSVLEALRWEESQPGLLPREQAKLQELRRAIGPARKGKKSWVWHCDPVWCRVSYLDSTQLFFGRFPPTELARLQVTRWFVGKGALLYREFQAYDGTHRGKNKHRRRRGWSEKRLARQPEPEKMVARPEAWDGYTKQVWLKSFRRERRVEVQRRLQESQALEPEVYDPTVPRPEEDAEVDPMKKPPPLRLDLAGWMEAMKK